MFWVNLAGLGADGFPSSSSYSISSAIYLDGSADYLLNYAPDTTGNPHTYSIISWEKRTPDASAGNTMSIGASAAQTDANYIQFGTGSSENPLSGGGTTSWRTASKVNRDPTAWMHRMWVVDTNNTTAEDRLRYYENGVRITAWGTNNDPDSGEEIGAQDTANARYIGRNTSADSYFNGYMADYIFLDGVALTDMTQVGQTNDQGNWVPVDPSTNVTDWGGNNSFWLKFDDSADLGKDSKPVALTAGTAATISNSVWFDHANDALTDSSTPAGDSQQTMTVGTWFKMAIPYDGSNDQILIGWCRSGTNQDFALLKLDWNTRTISPFLQDTSDVAKLDWDGPKVDDPTAWTHVVWTINTNSKALCRMWVNGVEFTDWTKNTDALASGNTFRFGASGSRLSVGSRADGTTNSNFGGYLAQTFYQDGVEATDINDYGSFDANGIWQPKDISGLSFGTAGFLLEYATAPGTGAGAGDDTSGNINDLTENSMTAAQQTSDTPSENFGISNANFQIGSNVSTRLTFANGNLKTTASNGDNAIGTVPWVPGMSTYYEMTLTTKSGANYDAVGLITQAGFDANTTGRYWWEHDPQTGYYYLGSDGNSSGNGAVETSSYSSAWDTSGKVIGVYISATGKVWFTIDGTLQNSAIESEVTGDSGTTHAFTLPDVAWPNAMHKGASSVWDVNYGQSSWNTTPFTGYTGLSTSELAAPTITDPRAHFATVPYGGTGGDRKVRRCYDSLGTAWTPGFVWTMNRDTGEHGAIWDEVRGGENCLRPTDTTTGVTSNYITGQIEGGFTVGTDSAVNNSGDKQIAWCLKAGGSGSSNTDGSITSTVSAASHGGFSVGTFVAGSTGSVTIGHGLSRAPSMLWVKSMDSVAQWWVYHDGMGAGKHAVLQGTAAEAASTAVWDNTAPTSTVFSTQDNGAWLTSGETHHFACFAKTPGLIGIGSYKGNGSTDGPHIVVDDGDVGFRPAFILAKNVSTAATNWQIYDAARDPENVVDGQLLANSKSAESTGTDRCDFLANGFKPRITTGDFNNSGDTFIYIAFADQPFKYARAR